MKDDDILEVLEHHDITVTYDFDRTHENIDDLYWAESKEGGFQFRFNKEKILDVVFLYMAPREGVEVIDRALLDVPAFETYAEAQQVCLEKNITYKSSPGEPGSPGYKGWIKLDYGVYTVHYQYEARHLVMITLEKNKSLIRLY